MLSQVYTFKFDDGIIMRRDRLKWREMVDIGRLPANGYLLSFNLHPGVIRLFKHRNITMFRPATHYFFGFIKNHVVWSIFFYKRNSIQIVSKSYQTFFVVSIHVIISGLWYYKKWWSMIDVLDTILYSNGIEQLSNFFRSINACYYQWFLVL